MRLQHFLVLAELIFYKGCKVTTLLILNRKCHNSYLNDI